MVIKTLHLKLLRDLSTLKAQALSISLLIICGVSLLIGSWSAYRALIDARDSFYTQYAFADLFIDVKKAPLSLTPQIQSIEHVSGVEPRIVLDGLIDLKQGEPAVGRFISNPSGSQPKLNRLYLRKGRLPSAHRELEVAVHEGFAQAHHIELGQRIDLTIQGKRKQARVVGVALSPEYIYALSPFAPLPDDQHFGVIWMPIEALEEIGAMHGAFNQICVSTEDVELNPIKTSMDRILKQYGGKGAYSRDQQPSHQFVNDEILQQKTTALVTPFVFLGVAAFLIQITSSRLVSLHRIPIATLKALGYTSREVSSHYLTLITLILTMGALPGLVFGAGLGQLYSKSYEHFFRFPNIDFSLSTPVSLLGLLSGILPGLLGAYRSIRAVFQLSPADAMKPPAPLAFHSGWMETLPIMKHLRASQRMTLRTLLFRPFRLLFSTLGNSAALALIIVAISWNDTIEFLLNTQFHYVQREDASVLLTHPIKPGGVRELLTLPGVLDAEGYRTSPIRLHFMNHKKELSLMGWPHEPRLRGRFDSHLKKTHWPGAGIVLSRYFETCWGMKRGDLVEVETLEGKPRRKWVQLSEFSDELIGVSASTDLQTLSFILDESPTYNLILLRTDPEQNTRLYIQLKQLPVVSGVHFKSSLYQGFKRTMGSIIEISMIILTLFALCLALGVIYNSVRVSLSERCREIASLRVLGFTQRETNQILFTESALQTSFSLLPGCCLGWWITRLILKGVNTEVFAFPVVMNQSTYCRAILVILFGFILSTLLTAPLSAKLSLADALKAQD